MERIDIRDKVFTAAGVLFFVLIFVSQGQAQSAQVLFFEDFEHGSDQWEIPGSAVMTTVSAFSGSHSQTFASVASGGDAWTFIFPVTPGQTYFLHVAYMTLGGGGYIGIDQFNEFIQFVGEQWMIGDGGYSTLGMFSYNAFNENPEELGVWKVYTQPYTIPTGVHFIRIKTEDWVEGLPNDPLNRGVFFDNIEWSTSPIPSFLEISVEIAVKPDGDHNIINLKSQGILLVAVLTTLNFFAPIVNIATVRLGDPELDGTAAPVRGAIVDVDGDGDLDLLLSFSIPDFVASGALDGNSTEVALRGKTFDGTSIVGYDSVQIVVPSSKSKARVKINLR